MGLKEEKHLDQLRSKVHNEGVFSNLDTSMTRNEEIRELYLDGVSFPELAKQFGISKQRVHQLLSRYNIDSSKAGARLAKSRREKEKIKEANQRCFEKHGCDLNTYNSIMAQRDSSGTTPQKKYRKQRKNAKQRKIEWKFNFYEWWLLWQESGQWENRGRYYGQYVMARISDKGPYSADNVEIITCSANISDGYAYLKKGLAS